MPELKLRTPDEDLVPLLRKCDREELDNLVGYITGKGKITSQLAMTDAYNKYHPDHTRYADEIAAEIQKYGGNTILNLMRGGFGVTYDQVARGVASKLGIKEQEHAGIQEIEQQILLKILEQAWEKMEDSEKTSLLKGIIKETKAGALPSEFPALLFKSVILAGTGFAAFKLSAIVAETIGMATLKRGISAITGQALGRWAAIFTGPVGLGITALWAAFDIAGPAYRVTVPCVLHIAMLRQLHNLRESGIDPATIR